MADLGTLQVKIALNDSSFQQGISNLKQQLAVADSSFKASMNGSKDWGKSLDGLKAYADSLGQKIKAQSGIVDMYSKALEKSQTNLKSSSQKMAELKIKLDEAKAAFNEQSSSLDKNSSEYKALKDNVDKAQKAYDQQEKAVIKNNKSMQGYQIQLNNSKAKLNELTGELKKTNESIDKQNSTWAKLKDGIKSHADSIKTAIGGIGIATASWLGKSISVAGTAEKTNADLAQTIKSTGGAAGLTAKQVSDMANKFSASTTYSAAMIKSGQNMLLTFTNIGKNVFPMATRAMLDMSTKMKTEPTQAAMQLGKALNDPIKGITALSRVGVSFSDSQKKVIKQMVSTGNTAGAQKIILQELNREFGGQATAAANTYEGSQQRLRNQLTAVQATIGNQLLPVLLKIVSTVAPVIQQVIVFIQQNPKLVTGILGIVAVLGTLIGGMSAINTVLGLFNIQLTMSQSLITGGVMLAVIALAAGATLIVTHWSSIKGFFVGLWSSIKSGVGGIGNAIKNTFIGGTNGIKTAWNGVKGFFNTLWNGIKTLFVTVWNGIRTAVMAIVTPFVNGIKAPFNTLKTGLSNIMNGIKTIFSGVWTVIKNVVLGIVLVFIDLVTGHFNKLHSDISLTLNNIKNGFSSIWSGIKSVVVGIVQALVGAVGTIFSGGANILHSIGSSIASFFSGLWSGIRNTTSSVWNGILGFFGSLPGRFASFMSGVGSAIIHGFDSAINFIKNLPSHMLEWGKDMINGLINGIKSMIGAVGNVVSSVGDKIRSFLHFSVPDEGPLADYESWMPDFMKGLAAGISNNKNLVTNAVKNLATDVSVGMKVIPAISGNNLTGSITSTNFNSSRPPVQFIFKGNYCFMNKEMIDYFAKKVSNVIAYNSLGRR